MERNEVICYSHVVTHRPVTLHTSSSQTTSWSRWIVADKKAEVITSFHQTCRKMIASCYFKRFWSLHYRQCRSILC